MKNILLTLMGVFVLSSLSAPNHKAVNEDYKDGEYLKYRVHYAGITAGFATLDLKLKNYNSTQHYHAVGKGWTSGVSKVFFKVNDRYETYINASDQLPSKFIRKVDEGGYTKDKEIIFDQKAKKVTVENKKYKTTQNYKISSNVQDLLSAFYYLRKYDHNDLKTGTTKEFKIFMDEQIHPFKVKVLGRETVKTNFGNVKAIKLRPYVQSGRVFKEEESVTFWVTDDNNLVPVLIKAELAVGSLKAEINNYKNLKYDIDFF